MPSWHRPAMAAWVVAPELVVASAAAAAVALPLAPKVESAAAALLSCGSESPARVLVPS